MTYVVMPEGRVYQDYELTDDVRGRTRPVIVIDPENEDQVEQLAEVLTDHMGNVRAALRSLIAPPKPPEPQGLGAVVEDARGRKWVRVNERLQAQWRPSDASTVRDFRRFSDIPDVVRVLSEGVTE